MLTSSNVTRNQVSMTCSARTGVLTARTASASRALIAAIGVWTIRSGAASAGGIWTGADYAHEARASAATIGFIGSGHIGSTLARLAIDAGHDVVMSNSRGPSSATRSARVSGPRPLT